ncbi:hypothetical protein [Pedobacter duraquae]|uniref:Uncharacterized protein n=1 Tax=Pedobacter duraquae TaxID=425511 RepID=A0A4R6IJ14_9SPHI|nr:hypothetical protein [Pedobacter duraquae]TDO21916.1 hypothetical protein CLV32_3024 [Pedobacter duraquae]
MSEKLTCPYCEKLNEIPDDCHTQDEQYETECSDCEKIFGFTVYYIKGTDEYKLPCANGGIHEYQPIVGAPREYFINRFRCSHCGEEKTINPEL